MLKKIILTFLLSLIIIKTSAQNIVFNDSDSLAVEKLLAEASHHPCDTNWMIWFANKFMGVPYVGQTLDKESEESLVVNLRELDCTTFIETVLALSKCAQQQKTSFEDYCLWLQNIRYIGGTVDYRKRQHYFTIWMEENERKGITETIRHNIYPFSATQRININYMTTHVDSYTMLKTHKEWIPGIRDLENSVNGKKFLYIPKANLKPSKENNTILRNYIHDGDIISILTSRSGLDTSHIAIAHWRNDGLHIIHASSLYKKVIDDPTPFYDYMMKYPKHIGIRICRML